VEAVMVAGRSAANATVVAARQQQASNIRSVVAVVLGEVRIRAALFSIDAFINVAMGFIRVYSLRGVRSRS
jgi:hypothetical protein